MDEDTLATWIDGRAVLLSESLSEQNCVAPKVCGVLGAFGFSAASFGAYIEDAVPANDVTRQASCGGA